MFSQEYNHPPFLVKSIASTGSTANLTFGQVGLFAQSTFQPVNVSTLNANDFVFFATGSFHTTDSLGAYNNGLKQSIKSIFFRPADVLEIRKSAPIAAVNETMILGWDGIDNSTCESLSFTAGSTYRFQVRVWGEDVYATYLHPVVRTFTMVTECDPSPNCTTGCVGSALDKGTYTMKMVDLINNDVELQKFVKAEAILSGITAPSTSGVSWTLTVADNGDALGLAAIQTKYPTYIVSRESYSAPYSVYVVTLANSVTPTAYTPTATVLLANCNGACPSGYTLTAAFDTYTVTRGIVSGTSVASVSGAVATTYISAYASAVSLASYDENSAVVIIKVPKAQTVTASGTDIVTFVSTTDATCTAPSGCSTPWISSVQYSYTTRKMCITLPKPCGSTSSVSGLLAAYMANVPSVSGTVAVSGSSNCAENFIVTQISNIASGTCGTSPSFTFAELPPYAAIRWTACPCSTSTSYVYGAAAAGIKITTAYQTPEFGPSFLPTDYFNVKPFHIDIQQIDDTGNACQSFWTNKLLNRGIMATQTGHYVAREYAQAMAYQAYSDIFQEVRMQEILDQLWFKTAIDKTASYTIYYIKLRQYRDMTNSVRDYSPEIFEYPFIIKTGDDTAAFENYIMGIFSKFGKTLLIK
jgi:hypothetical protein